MGYRGRDVEIAFLEGEQCLVVGCDSCGGIGSKELDIVQAAPEVVGRFTARVALLEVISTGALPTIISVTVANEPEPSSAGILQGVRQELESFSPAELPLAVSTEKNMPTRQTGVGVTVVGTVRRADLRICASQPGDSVYCLGLPKVGAEVGSPTDPEIVQTRQIRTLLGMPGIHDIIPVGSRGLAGETASLCRATGLEFIPEPDCPLPWTKSGGPATCALVACAPGSMTRPLFPGLPLALIGCLAGA